MEDEDGRRWGGERRGAKRERWQPPTEGQRMQVCVCVDTDRTNERQMTVLIVDDVDENG